MFALIFMLNAVSAVFKSHSSVVLLSNFSAKCRSYFSIICLLFWDLATNLLDSLVTLSVNTSVSSVKCISSWLIFFFKKKSYSYHTLEGFSLLLVQILSWQSVLEQSIENYLLPFLKMWALNYIEVFTVFCEVFSILVHFGSESYPLHGFQGWTVIVATFCSTRLSMKLCCHLCNIWHQSVCLKNFRSSIVYGFKFCSSPNVFLMS